MNWQTATRWLGKSRVNPHGTIWGSAYTGRPASQPQQHSEKQLEQQLEQQHSNGDTER